MKKSITLIIDFVVIVCLIFVDQITKYLAVANLKGKSSYILIQNVLEFRYLENRGAAFGILQNKKILFVIIAAVMFIAIIYVLIKLPQEKKYAIWHVFSCLILAGGIGNLIDRIFKDCVVDFIYFVLIDFPIFNFADILVTIGTIVLFIDIILIKKEEDLNFLKLENKKNDG